MLVCGDIHGDFEKLDKFLSYKNRKKHLLVGDYVDDFEPRTDREIIDCLQLAINSDATLLWGNHEVHYLKNHPFLCSGFRISLKDKIQEILYKNLDRFLVAYCEEQYLITHAGIHNDFPLKSNDIQKVCRYLNRQMKLYFNCMKYDKNLFNISPYRDGGSVFGGPLWLDSRFEKLNNSFPQVFGHTPIESTKLARIGKHINVDIHLSDSYVCFNTKEKKLEYF